MRKYSGKINQGGLKNQKGLTLIEMMFALVIVAVILGIGIVVYQNVQASALAYKAENGVLSLTAGVKSVYTTPAYQSLTPTIVIEAGKAPTDMVSGTGTTAVLAGLWGGTITLAPSNYNGGTNNAFAITYPNVPASECNSVLAAVAPNFPQITAGSGTGTVLKDDSASPAVVFDPAAAAAACNNTSNSITLTET